MRYTPSTSELTAYRKKLAKLSRALVADIEKETNLANGDKQCELLTSYAIQLRNTFTGRIDGQQFKDVMKEVQSSETKDGE